MTSQTETLILPRITYTGNGRQIKKTNGELALAVVGCKEALPARMRDLVGMDFVVYAAAPGCGKIVSEITRVDNDGIWGIERSNNVRELTVADVI